MSEVISARTESADLHYRFDAVARLGQAQLLGVKGANAEACGLKDLQEELFVEPGPLWWVFDWGSAEPCRGVSRRGDPVGGRCSATGFRGAPSRGGASEQGASRGGHRRAE